jgi:hypothetical protein
LIFYRRYPHYQSLGGTADIVKRLRVWATEETWFDSLQGQCTVELHLSGLIRSAKQPDMEKIRIIGFFLENKLHWQFEVRLLQFTVYTCI